MLGLLLVLLFLGLVLLVAELEVVVLQVPLFEGRGIDGDHAVLYQSLRPDQLVVAGVVDHINDTGLAGNRLAAPGKVALQEQRYFRRIKQKNYNKSFTRNVTEIF